MNPEKRCASSELVSNIYISLVLLESGEPILPYILNQGGILFWLRGNLRDRPGISPEITFIKKRIMTENAYEVYIF